MTKTDLDRLERRVRRAAYHDLIMRTKTVEIPPDTLAALRHQCQGEPRHE